MQEDVARLPLVGSIQNSVGMGFIGNQASSAICNALGARVVHAQSQFANAHPGVAGRTTTTADPAQFRRDVNFLINQQPGIIHIGYLPKPAHVEVVAGALRDFKGVVLLDPVIGDYKKGLYVSEETARSIRDDLLPLAQIITPNKFEAEVLIGRGGDDVSEFAYLNGLFDLGPQAVIVTSFVKVTEKQRTVTLFTNGYAYSRITSPYIQRFPGHGVGDIFASGVGAFVGLGGSPFASALLATALTARSVAHTTRYGGESADPVGALAKWQPLGYQLEDDQAMRFAVRSGVEVETLKATSEDGPRLKFAPEKTRIASY